MDIDDRRKQHARMLQSGTHHSCKFQSSWNKHGKNKFEFEILVYCPETDLLFHEQLAMNAFDVYRNGYNMCPVAGRPFAGRKHSEETKHLMSGPRGPQTSEWVEKRAAIRRGVPLSTQGKANVKAAAQNRKPVSEGVREIQTKALNDFNRSEIGRTIASKRNTRFWVNGVYEDLKEANIQMFKSEDYRHLVSENTKEWNKRRTPEFNAWCARKRGATVRGIPFTDPKPPRLYTAN